MKLYDITVPISNHLPVYPGDPAIDITRVQSLEAGDIACVSHLSFSTHIGTHIDPPAHFIRGGLTLDRLPLDVLIGPCRVIDTGEIAVIDAAWLEKVSFAGVTRILFKTRNARFWPRDKVFHEDFVYLEADAARVLVERGVRLVGIDYLSVEKFNFEKPETHWELLGHGVIVVEGLDLSAVPPGDYELICLPIKIEDGDGAPARVILREM